MTDTPTQFDYLLNAFEQASQRADPASQGYAGKRKAIFAYVRELEAEVARVRSDLKTAHAERNEAWYGDEARRHGHYSRNRDEID